MAGLSQIDMVLRHRAPREKAALYLTAAAAIAAVAVCLCLAILDGRALLKAQFGVGQREAEKTRTMIRQEIGQTRNDLLARFDGVSGQAQAEIRHAVDTLDGRLAAIQGTADARLADIADKADRQLTATNQTLAAGIVEIRGDMRPVFAEAHETLSQASGTIAVVRPQLLGLMAGGKVTAGTTAQAARRIDQALPEFLAIGREFGQASTRTAKNVEIMSRPDKWWLTGLKIGAPTVGAFLGTRIRTK